MLPGLVASDVSTRPLRAFLKTRGYAVCGWRLGRNLGLRDGLQEAMVDLVHELNDTHGRTISLVGWSLGGLYARQLAKMMPERVRQVITLGSPFAAGPKATNAWRVYEMASGRRADEEDPRFGGSLTGAPPVPTTAIFSRTDGICAWQSCREEATAMSESIEVESSHCGMGHPAWATIRPWSTRSPIVWRRPKANGRRSIALAGAVWFIRIRTAKRAASSFTPSSLGEVGLQFRVRGASNFRAPFLRREPQKSAPRPGRPIAPAPKRERRFS